METQLLVVEDNPVLLKVFRSQFKHLNVRSDFVSYGSDAIAIFQEKNYDLIFMDIMLPDMTGLDVTKAIRELELTEKLDAVPIIAITASGNRSECIAAGMSDFALKPVTIEDFQRFLNKWCPSWTD